MDRKDRAKIEQELDRELENTFPASDPPSIVQPHGDAEPPRPAKRSAAPKGKRA